MQLRIVTKKPKHNPFCPRYGQGSPKHCDYCKDLNAPRKRHYAVSDDLRGER